MTFCRPDRGTRLTVGRIGPFPPVWLPVSLSLRQGAGGHLEPRTSEGHPLPELERDDAQTAGTHVRPPAMGWDICPEAGRLALPGSPGAVGRGSTSGTVCLPEGFFRARARNWPEGGEEFSFQSF